MISEEEFDERGWSDEDMQKIQALNDILNDDSLANIDKYAKFINEYEFLTYDSMIGCKHFGPYIYEELCNNNYLVGRFNDSLSDRGLSTISFCSDQNLSEDFIII